MVPKTDSKGKSGTAKARAATRKSTEVTTKTAGRTTRPKQTSTGSAVKVQNTVPTVGVSQRPKPTIQEIRKRAYEIYLARGAEPGDAQSDWLRAEREMWELRSGQAKAADK